MRFKVRASYVSLCETEIEADNQEQAYKLAKQLDGGVFDTTIDKDDWQIDWVMPIKEESNDKN